MKTLVLIAALLLILFGAGFYVWRAKRRGQTCIGCPYSGKCEKNGACSCGKAEK